MKRASAAVLILWLGASAVASAEEPFPKGYKDPEAIEKTLTAIAEKHADIVALSKLTTSIEGRPVWLMTLGTKENAKARKPATLIVADLEADYLIGGETAVGLIEKLVESRGKDQDINTLLNERILYIVPCLNPDGVARTLKAPRKDLRGNARAIDRDRDGRKGEDGPDDLDGDGVTTRLRVKDAKASLVADAADARILRPADRSKGERAVFSEYSEGIDNDGDGLRDEDAPSGVNLNRNWPQRWTEFDLETGTSPASEPETRALIAFAFDHPEIVHVWSFSLYDTLRDVPNIAGSPIDGADKPIFDELSRLYKETLKQSKDQKTQANPKKDVARVSYVQSRRRSPRAGSLSVDSTPAPANPLSIADDGSLSDWAYQQFGVVGISARPWIGPELADPPAGKPKPPADGEARWLYWNDHVLDGQGFVPFHAFEHPTLGASEIGGWKPGVRINPPGGEIAAIVDAHFLFLKDLIKRVPALAIESVKVEAEAEGEGDGLFAITATIENAGRLPTALAQGAKVRKAPPVLTRLNVGNNKLLTGRPLERIDSLAPGARREYRWLVLASDDRATITLEVSCPKAGRVEKTIALK